MGFMVFTTGLIGINVLKLIKNKKIRWITIALLWLIFLLVWAELAVGIFDTPFAGSWKNTPPCRLCPKTYKKSAHGVFKALTNVFYKSQIKQTYDLWNSKRFWLSSIGVSEIQRGFWIKHPCKRNRLGLG